MPWQGEPHHSRFGLPPYEHRAALRGGSEGPRLHSSHIFVCGHFIITISMTITITKTIRPITITIIILISCVSVRVKGTEPRLSPRIAYALT